MAVTISSLIKQFFVFWASLVLIIVFYTDFYLPSSVAISDYLMTFHTAGWIAAHGMWSQLYPPAQATGFAGAPFDKIAHQLLPLMPASSVAEYMYMPISAYIFAPFSRLQPVFSLVAWQLTSLIAIGLSAFLIFAAPQQEAKTSPLSLPIVMRAIVATCATLAFFPTMFTIWIGQVGLLFGLLPLCLGYFLLRRGLDLPAGLAFALLFFKPQMLIPAFFMLTCQLAQKRWLALIGMLIGIMTMAQCNTFISGPELFSSWVHCLKISDKIYSDPSHGVAVHLATSMPRAILLSQPVAQHAALKPLLYGAALVLLLLGLGATLKFSLAPVRAETKINLAFILGCLALPVVVPHLFLYDLSVLSPLGFLIWGMAQGFSEITGLQKTLARLTALTWLSVTVYCSFMLCNQHLAQPLLLVSVFSLNYIWAAGRILSHKRQAAES